MFPLRDNLRCKLFPFATLAIIALNLLVWFYELMVQHSGAMSQFFSTYCMIPAKVVHAFAAADPHLMLWATISIFSSMFMHASWPHIIGNMAFYYTFGRALEARLGTLRYIGFYLLSGLAATLLQIWDNPYSTVPNLGASGAIAGVLGGYIMFWPKARVYGILLTPPLLVETWAILFLPGWFALQLLSVVGPHVGKGGVAYYAHIGGFLGGLVLAGLWKLYRPVCDDCYIPTHCDCPAPDSKHGDDDTTGGDSVSEDDSK